MELIPVLSGVAFAAGLGLSLHAVKLRRLANNAVKHAEDLVAHGTALMDLAKEKEQRALRLHERALAAENSARELHRSLDTVTRIHDSRVARQADQFISRMPSNVRGLDQHREIQLTSHAATTPHRRRSDTDSDWPTVEQRQHDDTPARCEAGRDIHVDRDDPTAPEGD